MSGRLVGEVFKYAPADLTPVELLVLVALAEQARDKDRTARYASAANLASYTRRRPGTVRNVLTELASRGLIQRVHDHAHIGKIQQYRIAELGEHHRTAVASTAPLQTAAYPSARVSSTIIRSE